VGFEYRAEQQRVRGIRELQAQYLWEKANLNTEFSEFVAVRAGVEIKHTLLERQRELTESPLTALSFERDWDEQGVQFAYQKHPSWIAAVKAANESPLETDAEGLKASLRSLQHEKRARKI
jgi:hypothetical protein